jgi:HK97 gp10 family phage protein
MPAYGIQIREDTVTPCLSGFTERMRVGIVNQFSSIGGEMVAFARGVAPIRTGFLRDSIFLDLVESDLSLTLGAAASYSSYVEFGTRRTSARPFIRPALDASHQRIVDAILSSILGAWDI